MTENPQQLIGLSTLEANSLLKQYGRNEPAGAQRTSFFRKALSIVAQPMFLLLLSAAVIYFVLGQPRDGAVMLIFVAGIISIDIFQEWKTDKTLHALRELSAPQIAVIRDGAETVIPSAELVPGDLMLLYEGVKIPADGVILRCSDLSVDESTLTGETLGVWKCPSGSEEPDAGYWRRDYCYAGTLVTQGSAAVRVEKTGVSTEYGKISVLVASDSEKRGPLQKQTSRLVTLCAGLAAALFVLVGVFTYFALPDYAPKERLIQSLLSGITLTMAMIPEEFPVILTVFLSMGAWRLAKRDALARTLPAVETLGAVSVLCVDKTGTITRNKMTVTELWTQSGSTNTLIEAMGLACETEVYDPMELAMLDCCQAYGFKKAQLFDGALIKEYPFTNALKMMGHVWRKADKIIISAKGSPESIFGICDISDRDKNEAEQMALALSSQGLRVIAVATAPGQSEAELPEDLSCCRLSFLGLVGLSDPPREGLIHDIETCKNAGIRVVMITGDSGSTACAIARQIGIPNCETSITGQMLSTMSDEALRESVKTVNIFCRVIPEHKLRIVNALKANGEVVAMTGDGVNDAPALKAADIGIAMGMRGSEVSREAADLILLDDNFSTIVGAVRDGRRIYDNIRKAVSYIFTIHIPIALSALLAPLLGIAPAALFLLPLHVVLLELVIDPTCSVVLERLPAETDLMARPPRKPGEKLISGRFLIKSLLQGLIVFAFSFGVYLFILRDGQAFAPTARAAGLTVLIFSNLLLVFVSSSERESVFRSLKRLMPDRVMQAVCGLTFLGLAVILYTPLNAFLKLAPLGARQLILCLLAAVVSVCWFELVKYFKKRASVQDKRSRLF